MIKTRHFLRIVLPILLALLLLLIAAADGMTESLRHLREQRCYNAILQSAAEFDIPVPLLLAVVRVESDFHSDAVSAAGAVGLMQLLPETFAYLGTELLREFPKDSDIYRPEVNIRYGSCYLAYLYRKFGDWETALAAYNAGEGRVSAWLKDPKLSPNGTLQSIPFPETAQYVRNAICYQRHYCEKYNF